MPEKRRKFDEDFRIGAVRIVYEAMIAKTCTRDAFEVVLARGAGSGGRGHCSPRLPQIPA